MENTLKTLSLRDRIAIGLIIVPFVAFYTIYGNTYTNATEYYWSTDIFQAVLVMVIGGILTLIYIRHTTPIVIYMGFFIMSLITVGFAPLRPAWLGGIIGNIEIPTYSVMMLIIAPAYIKACIHIHQKNPVLLPMGLVIFSIWRFALFNIYGEVAIVNIDFESVTSYALLIAICASVPLSYFKNSSRWVKLAVVLGICANIYIVYYAGNRTAIASLMGVSIGVAVWIYALRYGVKQDKSRYVLYALTPILAMIGATIVLYLYNTYSSNSIDALRTLWSRGLFIRQILGGMTWSDMVFGTGWGQAYTTAQDTLWVDGFGVTPNNVFEAYDYISGWGYLHSHNNLFEAFISMGVLGFAVYCAVWVYLSWCLRYRPWVLSIFTGYLVLNTTWYHLVTDMVTLPLMMTAIISNTVSVHTFAKNIYTKISEYMNMGLAGILILFFAVVYIPYIFAAQSKQMPESAFYDTWYNGDATNMSQELYAWRVYIYEMEKGFNTDSTPQQWMVTKLVDILDILKRQSQQGNRLATREILYAYDRLFISPAKHPVLEKVREREYPQWASAVLRANEQFNDRPELFKSYFAWHIDRDFHTAVMEVSKRILANNPYNAVALYWRGASLREQGKTDESDALLQQAFRHGISRYHPLQKSDYEKYKHLLDPRYR